jgi:hypothetical protein
MVKTAATLVFIAGVGAGAVLVGTRSTVASGSVMAADLLSQLRRGNPHLARLECDPEIPIRVAGAVFQCTLTEDDGSTARIEYTLDRDGSSRPRLLGSTPRTGPRNTGSGDPWSQ